MYCRAGEKLGKKGQARIRAVILNGLIAGKTAKNIIQAQTSLTEAQFML
jgi:hypothetical protein